MPDFLSIFWLIPLIPLVGVIINGLFGRYIKSEKVIAGIACLCILTSFVIAVGSVAALAQLPVEERHVEFVLYDWIPSGVTHLTDDALDGESAMFYVPFGFLLDPLSAVMILIITGVGSLIHIYAAGYMHGDKGYYRFFTYLNLFVFFMLILVLGNSYGLMFIGWEGVGLCSYLLIGYYISKKSAGDAGKKAFIVNRIGDLGMILGIFTIFFTFGSVEYSVVMEAAHHYPVGAGAITAACLFLLIGATGKSAQIPLYVWLPDAMEGPTPVSALIHAATMVTAGVYMIARSSALFALSPVAMTTVATIGAATALLAASIALVQNDIKRVLAYSTVSQLGYMVLACGVGAFSVGVFHLMTHAFFKALLFLGAGSVMHALHDELDMWKMGNVKKYMPTTHWTFLIGCMAIAGVPGLAGFFSKDEVLWYAWSGPHGHPIFWAVGALVAGMTAFYMFRMYFVVFQGESRMDPEVEAHAHESVPAMTIPLMVLAGLSIVGGYVGLPYVLRVGPLGALHDRFNLFDWLAPSLGGESHAAVATARDTLLASAQPAVAILQEAEQASEYGGGSHALEWVLMLASIAIAFSGIGLAYLNYIKYPGRATAMYERFQGVYRVLWNKYWVDELYDALFVNRTKDAGDALWVLDDALVDGTVNGVGNAAKRSADASTAFDDMVVDGAVNAVGDELSRSSRMFRAWQTGYVQNYALIIALGIFLIVSAYLFL